MDHTDVIIAVLVVVVGPPVLWLTVRYGANWPDERVTSPRLRWFYRQAAHVFLATMIVVAAIRLTAHFGVIDERTETILGIIAAVPFFAAAVPLIWYRVRYRMFG